MITHFTEIIVKFRKIHEKSNNYRIFLSLFVKKCIEMTEKYCIIMKLCALFEVNNRQ